MKFLETEVSWNALGIDIHGTVLQPAEKGTFPAVVFVAGSGPTDRNWCSPLLPGTNGSAKLISESLAENGFISIRYDKMASGPMVRENIPKFAGKISMQSHVDELAGAISLLASNEKVKADQIYALTNSEGAIHAINYQIEGNGPKFKGMILTGVPGRSVGDVARSQIDEQKQGFRDSEVILKLYDENISKFMEGETMKVGEDLPEPIRMLLKSLENPANLPFSRELWGYTVSEHLKSIHNPLKVIIGKKDIQVNWKADGQLLEAALYRNPSASFTYPENANHVLKHEEMPRNELTAEVVSANYNAPGTSIDSEAMDAIISWLKSQVPA